MRKTDFPPEIWDEIIAPGEVIDLGIMVDSVIVGIAFTVIALIGGLFG